MYVYLPAIVHLGESVTESPLAKTKFYICMKHILITRKSLFPVIVHVLVVNYYLYCVSASKPIHGPASHCARHSTNMTQKDDPYVGLGPNQPLPRIILNEPA